MKHLFLIALLFLSLLKIHGQNYKGQFDATLLPKTFPHYQSEYNFDTTINKEAWSKAPPGMQVSFVSTDQLFFRSEVPDLNSKSHLQITGWKGERLNAQLLIWSSDSLEQIRIKVNDLHNLDGKIIKHENVVSNLVRYVVSNYPYAAHDATCGESPYKNLYLLPDRFEKLSVFNLPARTLRPVWISFNIPQQISAGVYDGNIEIKDLHTTKILTVQLIIQNKVLPIPKYWKYRLDLWQNPWVVAAKYNLKPWGNEHLLLLKKHLELYAEAGGKFITTYAVNSPWSDNSYTTEGGMINWTKKKNGSWMFDYKIFDTYVRLAMSVGISNAITIYTPVPNDFRFNYIDEATGNMVIVHWPPASNEFKQFWKIFLTDLKTHLEKNGWFDKTYLGINEIPLEETLAAIKVIKDHSKSWKITYAGNWHKELDNLLNDYSFLYGNESNIKVVNDRSAKGFTTTFYNCCNPPFPNNFIFSPPIESRWLGWYAMAHNYNGFLRWAYDAWPADPDRDARHQLWPAGDCFITYPGGNSCIRFEKLREGIVDYEKIRIIKEIALKSTDKSVLTLIKQLDDHLQTFMDEKTFTKEKIQDEVDKGNALLIKLSNILSSGHIK